MQITYIYTIPSWRCGINIYIAFRYYEYVMIPEVVDSILLKILFDSNIIKNTDINN